MTLRNKNKENGHRFEFAELAEFEFAASGLQLKYAMANKKCNLK